MRLSAVSWILYVALICVFITGPTIVLLGISLSSVETLAFPPPGLSLQWYQEVISSYSYIHSFENSAIIASCATLVASILGIVTAYGIGRYRFRGRNLLNSFFVSPILFPTILTGVALLEWFSVLRIFGLPALILAHLLITTPYSLRLILSSLYSFNPALEEAAVVLGASRLRTFLKVSLPILRPAIISGALFAFAVSFDNISISLFLTSPATNTTPVLLYVAAQNATDPSIAAVSAVFVAIAVVVIVLVQKFVGLQFVMK